MCNFARRSNAGAWAYLNKRQTDLWNTNQPLVATHGAEPKGKFLSRSFPRLCEC